MTKPPIKLLLASPRGFCAGVDRAIQIVEKALERYGAPVYVRHEIVHNQFVVDQLRAKGAIFVDELDQVPSDRPVIFSAHGVPKKVPAEAQHRQLIYVDATCPLVSKVHREAERLFNQNYQIILIGHADHPEVIGTMGQLPDGAIQLVETIEDAKKIEIDPDKPIGYITQTTLSVDDTISILAVLKQRFPQLQSPKQEDICYATTNRQAAVKAIAAQCDILFVIGSETSSNAKRLVEVSQHHGCPKAFLINNVDDIPWFALNDIGTIGLTAGASTPEILVDDVIAALEGRFDVDQQDITVAAENIHFKLPRQLFV